MINLAGAGVGARRWRAAYRREIQRSRVATTATLSSALAAAAGDGADRTVLLNASAIGFYGDRGAELLDERSTAGPGFLAEVCRAWERSTCVAEDCGVRVCHLRIGHVLGPGGGLLARLRPLFRAGLGGTLGTGRQHMSWLSLADTVRAVRFLIERDDIAGPVNLTAPQSPTNAEFTRAFGRAVRRPAVLAVPRFALRIALGELAGEVLSSARVRPSVLLAAGFRYEHADVSDALRWALKR
ncbi:MAG: TIGR01777 family oxidoreductase [Kutzneria sp.]|nr:TIGR01777 family oxidoreductase [Kutzneria sp.]